jgi:hypothetical protein
VFSPSIPQLWKKIHPQIDAVNATLLQDVVRLQALKGLFKLYLLLLINPLTKQISQILPAL